MIKFFLLMSISLSLLSQEIYSEIGPYYKEVNSNTIICRMLDGLGYRYHWASKDLNKKDLEYMISEDSRSTLETLQHIYSLSNFIAKTANNEVVDRIKIYPNYPELRELTLQNIKKASQQFLTLNLSEFEIKAGGEKTFPIWNLINGPVSDAIYHTGQITSYRRASGNPINEKVNVFTGKNNE